MAFSLRPDGSSALGRLSEHHHLECSAAPKALVCVSSGLSLNAKTRAKLAGCTNGLTSVEFAHNLGLMCDVLSELKDLSKQSGRKRKGRAEEGQKPEMEGKADKQGEEEMRAWPGAAAEQVQLLTPQANGPCKFVESISAK